MLSTVASALILAERRRLVQVIPGWFIQFLNEWELKVLILLSLTLQILLSTLGNRRKYICKIWIRITLFCAYLLADWVAIVSLGIIAKSTLDDCHKGRNVDNPLDQLMWFWAQFFLLHLGGPDTITAYSLEDNELWLRHLVALVIQTGLAFYILLVALPGSSLLPKLSIFIFVAGLIKYGERLLALFASNSENFRDSMVTEPDPGPNYAKFMEEFTLKKAEGFYVEAAEVIEIPVPAQPSFPNDNGKLIPEAYELFLKFKCLFADAILSFQDRDSSQQYFQNLSPEEAFDVVEVELGFMFDELYTKAPVMHKARGIVFRTTTFSATLIAFLAFVFLVEKKAYMKCDLMITFMLLGVAIFLEIYAVWVLINSDWTHNWLSRRHRATYSSLIIQWFQRSNKRRWSKKMAQHSLLDLCVRGKSAVRLRHQNFLWKIRKLSWIDNYLEKHWYKTLVDVSPALKDLIFTELARINKLDPTALWNRRGSFTLENYGNLHLDWTQEVEFDQRILLWHIATDICYSKEWGDDEEPNCTERKQMSDHSKHISDYMLYLLIACPFMLPIGIGMIRFRDTCAEAKEFLEERNVRSCKTTACKKLLQVNTEVPPTKVKGDRSKSVLFDACRMAKFLLARKEDRWEIISKLWVEMLAHAASHCGWRHHARQLRKGGELLTHVWLLMAHLGITEQFQISQGHARAKLIVK
ncbi:uncharacterized protein LOC105163796 [Sesamum indicum]|uniref:Uncharacterized protein LOC105163796 n=1 Tax=Sesamum indicum TaxID=4182 RepID=A0A6I9T8L3_SESIN|nr:uncharacterized protein LOC105163796 [Sesamum indicum]